MAGNINTNINLNVKSTGTKRATKDITALNAALRKIGASADSSAKGSDRLNRNTTRLGQSSASAGRQFSAQAAGLGGLVGAYAGAAATVFALQQAFSALNRAAQVENIIRGTQTLAAKVGENGTQILRTLQDITQGQISLGEVAEKTNLALSTGFNTKQIQELGNISTKVSIALGRNLSDAFERLTRGAAKLEPELLDELGIFTKLDPATRKYAKEIGKAASDLTEFERRQAFVNAIIEEGNRKFSEIDTSVPSAQKSLNRLSATLQDLGHNIGFLLAEELTPLIDFFTKDMTGAVSVFAFVARQAAASGLMAISAGFDSLAARGENFAKKFGDSSKVVNASAQGMKDFQTTIKGIAPALRPATDEISNQAKSLNTLAASGNLGAESLLKYRDAQKAQLTSLQKTQANLLKQSDSLRSKIQSGQKLSAPDAKAFVEYERQIKAINNDLTVQAQRVSAANAALSTQTTRLKVASVAARTFGGAVKFASAAVSTLFRALNVFLLALAFGPIILEILGKIDLFNRAIEALKENFLSVRQRSKDLEMGIRSLATSSAVDIDTINDKFRSLGLTAREVADNTAEAFAKVQEALTKAGGKLDEIAGSSLGGDAIAAGVGGTVLGGLAAGAAVLTGTIAAGTAAAVVGGAAALEVLAGAVFDYDSKVKGLVNSVAEYFFGVSNAVEDMDVAIRKLGNDIDALQEQFNNTGDLNLLQQIEVLKGFERALASTTAAQVEFVGTLARISGQSGQTIQGLTELNDKSADLALTFNKVAGSSDDLIASIGGVDVGVSMAGGRFRLLNAAAAAAIPNVVGFVTALTNSDKVLSDNSTGLEEFVTSIESLKTAQSNLQNFIESGTTSLENYGKVIDELFTQLTSDPGNEALRDTLSRTIQDRNELQTVLSQSTALLNQQKTAVESLSTGYDEAAKTLAHLNNIQKEFKSAADQMINADLKGFFVETANGIEVAATPMQRTINQINVLKGQLNELSSLQNKFRNLAAEGLGTFDEETNIFTPTDQALTSMKELGLEQKTLTELVKNREFIEKAILGILYQQVQAIRDQEKELNKLLKKAIQENTQARLQAEIAIAKAQLAADRAEMQQELKLMGMKANNRQLQLKADITRLRTTKEVLEIEQGVFDARKESLNLETSIANARVEGVKQELRFQKDIISLARDALDEELTIFDEKTIDILNMIADLGDIALDVKVGDQDKLIAENNAKNVDALYDLDRQKIDFQEQIFAAEVALAEAEMSAREEDLKARKEIALFQARGELSILEQEKALSAKEQELMSAQQHAARENLEMTQQEQRERFKDVQNMRDAMLEHVGGMSEKFNAHITGLAEVLKNGVAITTAGGAGPTGGGGVNESELTAAAAAGAPKADLILTADEGKVDPRLQSAVTQVTKSLDNTAAAADNLGTRLEHSGSTLDQIQTLEADTLNQDHNAALAVAAIESKAAETAIKNKKEEISLLGKQFKFEKDILNAERSGMVQKFAAQSELNDLQLKNLDQQAELTKIQGDNAKKAADMERFRQQQALIQKSFQTIAASGMLIQEMTTGKIQKEIETAAEQLEQAKVKEAQALEKLKNLRDQERSALDATVEVLERRRDLERDLIDSVRQLDASSYIRTQEEFAKSFTTLDEKADSLKEASVARAVAEADLAIATLETTIAINNHEQALADLADAEDSIAYKISEHMIKLGKLGNSMSAITSLTTGLANAFSSMGNLMGAMQNPVGMVANPVVDAIKGLGGILISGFKTTTSMENGTALQGIIEDTGNIISSSIRTLRGFERFGAISPGAEIAIADKLAQKEDVGILDLAGASFAKSLTPVVSGFLKDGLSALINFASPIGSMLGTALDFFTGGALGDIVGKALSWIEKQFAGRTWSSSTTDLATGDTTTRGKYGSQFNQVSESVFKLNNALEAVVGQDTRFTSAKASFVERGGDVKQKDLRISGGGAASQVVQVGKDAEKFGKDVFEALIKGFDPDSLSQDLKDAIANINFNDAVEENLKKLNFARGFDDLITQLEVVVGNFDSAVDYADTLYDRVVASSKAVAEGALQEAFDLIEEASKVFGETSTQVDRARDATQNLVLSYAGLNIAQDGTVRLLDEQAFMLSNMEMAFISARAETEAFADSLIASGIEAEEAARIIEEGTILKLKKLATDFGEAITDATRFGGALETDVIDSLENVLRYQREIVRDAAFIQEELGNGYDFIKEAEQALAIQRDKIIREATDVELRALSELSSAGQEFSNAAMKAAADAELTRRVMNNIFDGAKQLTQAQRGSRNVRRGLAFATGGFVPGTPEQQNKDSVPALLMPGEFVINKEAVDNVGLGVLAGINEGRVQKLASGTDPNAAPVTGVIAPDKLEQFGGAGATIALSPELQEAFKKFSQDVTLTLETYEAREIVAQSNNELFEQYIQLQQDSGAASQAVVALNVVLGEMQKGATNVALATFDMAAGLTTATTATEALNMMLAENTAKQVMASASINFSDESVSSLSDSLESFYYNVETSAVTASDLQAAISEMNIALSQGAITGESYGSVLDDLTSDFDTAIAQMKEYQSFFLDLQDTALDPSGIIAATRQIVYAFEDGMDTIDDAVEDGFIDAIEGAEAYKRVFTVFEQERKDLVKEASEEQLKVIKSATDAIVDATVQGYAQVELAARQIVVVSKSFGDFEQSLVGFYNALVSGSGEVAKTLSASVVSDFQNIGFEDISLLSGNFVDTLSDFGVKAKSGQAGIADLSTAIGELNYQLVDSEDINMEQYAQGFSFLQSSFTDFLDLFSNLRSAFSDAQNEMDSFKDSLNESFKSIAVELEDLLKSLVETYKGSVADVKSMYQDAVAQQTDAEETLYNTLFSAQQAFVDAGGYLDGHISRIDDIVNELDPQYKGYSGLDQYLKQLQIDVTEGLVALGDIDTVQPLSSLQDNLANSLAELTALEALPDSADKFVKISRKLSEIDDINNQIEGSGRTEVKDPADLQKATLDLLKIQEELNFNNLDAGLKDIDLTITEVAQDLVSRALTARDAFNEANVLFDDFNTALTNNFTPGLVDSVTAIDDTSLSVTKFIDEMTKANQAFADIQTAIADVNATGVQEIIDVLDIINNPTDQVTIDVSDNTPSQLSELAGVLTNFENIINAKVAYENLYGSISAVTPVLPIDEFNKLNTELTDLEATLTGLLGVMGNNNIADIDKTFEAFIVDAIALLQNPLTISNQATSGSTTSIVGTVTGGGSQPSGVLQANNPLITAQNAILQDILSKGLGVSSPGYLFYTNQLLEQIRTVLEDTLLFQGGVLPTYAAIVSNFTGGNASTTTGGGATTGGGTGLTPNVTPIVTSGLDILGTAGQLFQVGEPITKPADYFYIVTPKVVSIDHFYLVEPIEIDYSFFFDIVPVSVTSLDVGGGPYLFNISPIDTQFDEWFNDYTKIDTQFDEWFNEYTTIDTKFNDWLTIVEEETGFFDWINITKTSANYQTFFNSPDKTNHSIDTWYNLPTKSDHTAQMWYNAATKLDTDYQDWFKIGKVAVKYSDFFDPEDKITLTDHIDPVTVKTDKLITISKVTKDAEDFYQLDIIETDADYFFLTKAKEVDYRTFFKLVSKSIDEFIEITKATKSALELFTISKDTVMGLELIDITPDDVYASQLITIDPTSKIKPKASDVFQMPTEKMAMELGDIFSNFASGEFDWTKAIVSVAQVIDVDRLEEGLANKAVLETGHIFENFDGDKFTLDTMRLTYEDMFSIDLTDIDYKTFFKLPAVSDKESMKWDTWFTIDPDDKIKGKELFALVAPEPVSADALYTIKKMEVDGSSLFKLSGTPQTIDANNLYIVNKVTKEATDLFKIDNVEVEGSDLIDLSHLDENRYIAKAADVLKIDGKLFFHAGNHLSLGSSQYTIDAGKAFKIEAVDKSGSDFYTLGDPSSKSGASFFTPTKSAIKGANFWSVEKSQISAGDLYDVSAVQIDVGGTFETEMTNVVDAIVNQDDFLKNAQDHLQNIAGYAKVSSEKLTNMEAAAKSFYEAELKNTAYIKDIITSLGDLAGIKANTADIKTNTSVNVDKLTKIESNTDNVEDQLDHLSEDSDHLSENLDAINTLLTDSLAELKTLNGYALYLPGIFEELEYANDEYLKSIKSELEFMHTDLNNMVVYLETIATNSAYLKTMDEDTSSISTAFDNKVSHLSDNLDHLSNNLDSIITNTEKNRIRYKYKNAEEITLATGGPVIGPGTSTSDSIPARLSNGEYVIKANSAKNLGRDVLDTLNATGSIASLGRNGDTQLAHINSLEASLLKSMGGAGSKNPLTGLKEFFFDGRPPEADPEPVTALKNSQVNYLDLWSGKRDGYPQFLWGDYISSYSGGYDANPQIGHAVTDLIKSANYAKGGNLKFVHKNWGRIGDLPYGQYGNYRDRYSDFGYDWNSWNNSVNATGFGNPKSLEATYGRNDWDFLAHRIWKTWGVKADNITSEGRDLAEEFGIPGFAAGGLISGPGTGLSDSIMAMLSDGEYIVRNSAVDNVGVNTLDYINNTGQLPQGDTNVEVNITNNGSPVDVETEPKVSMIDGKIVVDVVLKDLRTNGPIKKSIKKIK